MKSVLDPSFRYTPSYDTDVRKTFERIRREREAQAHPHSRAAAGPNQCSSPRSVHASSTR